MTFLSRVDSGIAMTALISLSFLGCSHQLTVTEKIDRARVLCDRDRADEALEMLKQAIAEAPENAQAHYLKGIAFERKQEFEQAKSAYDSCLKISPKNSDALNNRGVIQARLGNLSDSLADLQEATNLNAKDSLAWANLALAQHDLGLLAAAEGSYRRALEIRQEPRFYFQLGNVYLDAEKYQAALEAFDSALKLDPHFANGFLNRAIARIELQQLDLAMQDMEQAKRNDQDMLLRPALADLRQRLQKLKSNHLQSEELKNWLTSQGWQFQEGSDRGGLPIVRNQDGRSQELLLLKLDEKNRALCEHSQAQEALRINRPMLLVVIDPNLLHSTVKTKEGDPLWLSHVRWDYVPTDSEFLPTTVAYQPNASSAASSSTATEPPSPPAATAPSAPPPVLSPEDSLSVSSSPF